MAGEPGRLGRLTAASGIGTGFVDAGGEPAGLAWDADRVVGRRRPTCTAAIALAIAGVVLLALGFARLAPFGASGRGAHLSPAPPLVAVLAAAGDAAAMASYLPSAPAHGGHLARRRVLGDLCLRRTGADSTRGERARYDHRGQVATGSCRRMLTVASFWSQWQGPGCSTLCRWPTNTRSRYEVFSAAVIRHIELVVAAIVPALLIGVPLGLLALRRKRFETPLFAVLNLLQTIPSIALFGLLIGPLSGLAKAVPALGALGVGGVGPAPAIIALVLYALLPIARGTVAGIGGVLPAVIDAGRGMGMTPRQLFWQAEVPLALPVLLASLRIVTVQTIGLAVVAALIGAGGLGMFVFDGLGQYATNLVVLGALPAILLALGVDFSAAARRPAGLLRCKLAP